MDIGLTGPAEQTRARYPDASGHVSRDGVRLYYEVYGSGEPTVLLLPTWSIIHSRHWKMQIPDLARHCRVVTFDGRGNGRSDRPAAGYDEREFAADALAVLDATATPQAVIVSLSLGAQRGLLLAAEHPDRVAGAVFIAPAVPIGATALPYPWDSEPGTDAGWAKYNRSYWLRDYRGFLEFFFAEMFSEPHSTKPAEDCVGWGLETTAQTLVATEGHELDEETVRELSRRVRCPVLVIQGTEDAITGQGCGIALAEATGGELVLLQGSGHGPHVRDPVKVNLLLREFAVPRAAGRRWVRGRARRKRALYVSSPIGLGHAQRDAAIAGELRKLHPDLEIDWLAQHPVTRVLEARGERVHPASALLASESGSRAAADPGLDRAALRLRWLHHRFRPIPARRPRGPRLPAGRAGLHRDGRRLGGRRPGEGSRSSISRSATTSSRISTCATGFSATAPGDAWITSTRARPRSPPPSPARSARGRLPAGRHRRRRPCRRHARRPALAGRPGRYAAGRQTADRQTADWQAAVRGVVSPRRPGPAPAARRPARCCR